MQIETVGKATLASSLELITMAFATAAHSDGHEAELVAALRQSAHYHPEFDVHYHPEFDVVAVVEGQAVGHALLSEARVCVDGTPVLVLAPLAVLPAYQNQGIGGALIRELELRAADAKFLAISILGDPDYYGRFGYRPADEFEVTAPMAVESKYFMLKVLGDGRLDGVGGELRYDSAFGI